MLAAVGTTLLALASTTCPDGRETYGAFVASYATQLAEAAVFGPLVGVGSQTCSLPVTPRAATFQIWQYIYSQETALAAPWQLREEEMFHLARTGERSAEWFRSFAAPDGGGDNLAAVEAVRDMECHMAKAARHACETEPRAFACCTFTQHHTWLRVAAALSEGIYEAYGDRCGTRRQTDAQIERAFAARVGEAVRTLPGAGVEGVALATARATLAWALRGLCGTGVRDECVALANVTDADAAPLDALRAQGDLAWAAALACVPALPALV